MSRRRKKGRPVSGWVILDKPVGMGSTEAVSKVKWLYQADKAGHAGTLDPLASGMLPIALGEATKTVPFVMDGGKIYRFSVAWGAERSTDDLEGAVTATSEQRPSTGEIRALLPKYTGIIWQVPPQFSAVRVSGERAYDLARDGEVLTLEPREIEIARIDLIDCPAADRAVFEVECGKGTYVRSLARDMGRDLGCYGYVAELRRQKVEPFEPEDLVTVDELVAARAPARAEESDIEAPADFTAIDGLLVDTLMALDGLPQIRLGDDAANRVRLGNPVILRGRDAPVEAADVCATAHGRLVAIGAVEAGMFKPRRVFSL